MIWLFSSFTEIFHYLFSNLAIFGISPRKHFAILATQCQAKIGHVPKQKLAKFPNEIMPNSQMKDKKLV